MGAVRQTWYSTLKLTGSAVALAAAFYAGMWVSSSGVLGPVGSATGNGTGQASPKSTFRTIPFHLAGPRKPEPRAAEERARVIRRDAAAIAAECQRASGGDWEKWQLATAPYRAALQAKVTALKDLPNPSSPYLDCRYQALEGLQGFPLFEIGSRVQLNYLYDPDSLDEFRSQRPVLAASRWLRQQGIDLIFVPVPKMTEVYIDHFLDPCPPDGIIAPHSRRMLLEMLDADVEVVDGLALFRPERDVDAEYLYNTADTHWAPRGMRVMAKEIADRVQRYPFGRRARSGLPIVQVAPGPYLIGDKPGGIGSDRGWMALSPEQRERADAVQTTELAEVRLLNGDEPRDDPTSPVLLVGHSYARKFREQLIKELNLQVSTRIEPGLTTQAFADFLREPELLAHCHVVVWICTEQHMTSFAKLPTPVVQALKSEK
jgi:hypothetical protein